MRRNSKKSTELKIKDFKIISFSVFILFFIIILYDDNLLFTLCAEDNVVEWLQVVFLAGASIIAAKDLAEHRNGDLTKKGISIAFILFCVWVALEEISYGQRLLNFQSPYYFLRQNAHREVNLHNLPFFDSASEVATTGILAVWGILLPIILAVKKNWKLFMEKKCILTPDLIILAGCASGLILELIARSISKRYWPNSNEILEFFLYFSFFAAVLTNAQGRRQDPGKTG